MIYFAIAVLLGISIYLIFRFAGQRGLHTFSVIVSNYWVCSLVGWVQILIERDNHLGVWKASAPWAATIGLLFVTSFYLIAVLTKERGVGISSILSRVSLVIPVLFFLTFSQETMRWWQGLGVLTAVAAIVLINWNKGGQVKLSFRALWLPIVVFIGYGIIDILLKLAQDHVSQTSESYHVLTTSIFTMAALYGTAFKFIRKVKLSFEAIKLGALLGLINYYSIFFFFEALEHSGISSTIIFPLNSVLILVGANLLSVAFLKEYLGVKKVIALLLAICSIILLNITSDFG